MTQNVKILIVVAIAILFAISYNIYAYNTSDAIWQRTESKYQERIHTLSGSIQSLRAERQEKDRLHRSQDEALSGSINSKKTEMDRLQLCLQSRSIDCEGGKREAMLSLIPSTYATEREHLAPISEVPKRLECAISTGSHDVRPLAKNHPWIAGWRNNNTSGITLGSKALERAFDEAGILWYVGTARPTNEWSYYYWFPDLENWLKAKLLIIRRSYKNHSIGSFLRVWGTDSISSTIDTSRTIASLSDIELLSLTFAQITKESGKTMADYIRENVLICNY